MGILKIFKSKTKKVLEKYLLANKVYLSSTRCTNINYAVHCMGTRKIRYRESEIGSLNRKR